MRPAERLLARRIRSTLLAIYLFSFCSCLSLEISKIGLSLLRSVVRCANRCTQAARAATRRRSCAAHRCADAALLLRRELENIFNEKLGVVLVVAVERGWCGAGERPAIVFALEQAGRHGGAGADGL